MAMQVLCDLEKVKAYEEGYKWPELWKLRQSRVEILKNYLLALLQCLFTLDQTNTSLQEYLKMCDKQINRHK